MREEALSHFRKDERPFVERMADWVGIVSKSSTPKQTDFMDPRQLYILHTIVNRYPDLELYSSGGYSEAERKRAVVTPTYIPFDKNSLGLSLLEVKADQRFHQLNHGDYLGALLNIGLKREKFGDILVRPNGAQIIVSSVVAPFVQAQLTQVHRQPVSVSEISFNQVSFQPQDVVELSFTVASMRLDAVASDCYNISRSKIVPLIRAGKCKVNWVVIEDPSVLVKEGDTLSLQGYGRCQLLEVDGVTKKGRTRLKVGRLK